MQQFTPTHIVPAGGTRAWVVPDPTLAPAAMLDAGLEVETHERRGDWTRIVCSNGWAAWVDARQLLPMAAPLVWTPPAPTVTPPAAWTPTHRAAATGMQAWSAPDPAQPPAAALDPGLEVQVIDRAGDWAHIVCSNGWQAWVDARQLVAAG